MNNSFPDADDTGSGAGPVLRQIGDHLRMAREERGATVRDVAAVLRIRTVYLENLEAGDLARIPGRAYALGFLRSYADHLGFDGEAIVDEVKRTNELLPESPQLHAREPLPESQRPPLLLVGLSLVLAAAIYAGWSYWQPDQAPADLAAPLTADTPTASDEVVATAPVAAAPEPEPPAAAVEPPQSLSAEIALPPLPPIPEPPLPDAASLDDDPADTAVTAADDAAVAAILDQGTETLGETASGADQAVDAGASDGADAAAGDEVTPAPSDAPAAAVEPAQILASIAAESGGEARPLGDLETGGRVVLFASEASWVQIRSEARDFVWTRTMEPGDAYFVPDRDDLALWTGNAGGLRLIVDGERVSELGARGEVRRDIPLAADALSAQYAAE